MAFAIDETSSGNNSATNIADGLTLPQRLHSLFAWVYVNAERREMSSTIFVLPGSLRVATGNILSAFRSCAAIALCKVTGSMPITRSLFPSISFAYPAILTTRRTSFEKSQFPTRKASFFAPLTRRIPAACLSNPMRAGELTVAGAPR
jgi:hypothetical protein